MNEQIQPIEENKEQLPKQDDSRKPKSKQMMFVALGVVVALGVFGLFATLTKDDAEVPFNPDVSDLLQNTDALGAELGGFSYAYGTESTDDGTQLDAFVPATEEQLQQFIEQVASDEEQFDGEEDRQLIEMLEFDEWNDDGQVQSDVIESFINGQEQ